jgi:thiol-disulfide isomerase/thioredoxin
MKNKIFFTVSFLCFVNVLFAQSLVFNPDEPKSGEKVSFVYNPSGTPLAGEKNIQAVAYCINRGEGSVKEISLKKNGNVHNGSFVTDTNTLLISMSFTAGDKKDINKNKGYMVAVRDKNGKLQPGTYNAYADQYSGYGKFLYGLDEQPDYAFNYRKQEWNEFPEDRSKNLFGYLQAISSKKKKEGEPEILQILNETEAAGNLTEMQYNALSNWYMRLKQKDKAEALKKEMKEKFPEGNWKKNEKISPFFAEQYPLKKEALLNEYVQAYPPVTEADKNGLNYYYYNLAGAFAQPKDAEKRNVEKFKLYASKLPMPQQASLYNDVSWELALKDSELAFDKEISSIATNWAKKEMSAPSQKQPTMVTLAKWEENRKNTYAMFADTYAYIMYKLKNYNEGLSYAKDAINISKRKKDGYNDRYALLLEKTATPTQVQKELEPLIKDGALGSEGKAVLRRALISNMKSEQKADEYFTVLTKASEEKAKAELMKKMLDENASTFTLKNMQGQDVSLASLKGKVVVLDFWATWCGPCKASFPGMQKAIDKYKNNENVVFLFINTWEQQETMDKRKKEVTDFIAQNKYTFNVLYDESIKDDPDNFIVVNNYKVSGIPTKFVIGKDGKLRFKSVGFSGTDEKLVDEISAMIDLSASK